ncbi:SMP-30/gluconolactonase/LRE family protein [Lignipirellula cremea]|uniref:Gluconolactonase n=1 Tax=Lignipirellula cremea TaxID=2528010 RepID=A0A518DWB3_9BACT|nr:SMP-30/gluconolactonase/LRE family protein [Lignipirellula cremea]QDU96131.1 Gluconolactonase precursor [Lignipirellula cremea]
MRFFAGVGLLCFAVLAQAAEVPPPEGDAIVSPDSRLEPLFTRTAGIRGGLTEGPAVAPDGSIYFSDIPFGNDSGMILRFNPQTKQTTVFVANSGKSNGLVFDRQGKLVACEGADHGGRRIVRWDTRTKKRTVVADRFDGKRFNSPNDICLDKAGRIYFSDPRYVGDEERELTRRSVYRIDTDGTVMELTKDIAKPNGLAIAPDGKTLIVSDLDNGTDRIDPTKPRPPLGVQEIVAYPLDDQGLIAGPKRRLVDFGDQFGCDGMTVDRDGNIYLSVRDESLPGVMVINPEGKEIGYIPTGPANQRPTPEKPVVGLPSNVEFGLGEESNMLYITVDQGLVRIRLKTHGFHAQYEND